MGKKGARLTSDAQRVAEELAARLAVLGEVAPRKMFGGLGLFRDGVMFAIVDSSGGVFLRAGDETVEAFHQAGSERHGKMPYYAIPSDVLGDDAELTAWAARSADEATRAKKGS